MLAHTLLSLALLSAPRPDPAVERGLTAIVHDPFDDPLPGAQVAILRGESRIEATRVTDQQGMAIFGELAPGLVIVQATLPGFQTAEQRADLAEGTPAVVELRMDLPPQSETIEVVEVVERRPRPFNLRLTREDLDQLSDDPAELASLLRSLAGESASIRVDGFRGSSLPPPSQILELMIRTSAHAAEYHEPAGAVIDIVTRPTAEAWHGGLSGGLPRDEQSRLGWDVSGPIGPIGPTGRRRALLSASGQVVDARGVSPIVALTPESLPRAAESEALTRGAAVALTSPLGANHVVRLDVESLELVQRGLGAGGLDLPERAYSQRADEGHLAVSASSRIGAGATNDARVRWAWKRLTIEPASRQPTLDVTGVFRTGGAGVSGSRQERLLEVADDFRWTGDRASLDAGAILGAAWLDSREAWNATGTYTFDNLVSFRAGWPARFTQRVAPAAALRELRRGAYAQTEFGLGDRWWVGLGVRYEMQSVAAGRGTLVPRLDLSFSPRESGETTVRLGGGLFHEWLDLETVADARADAGDRPYDWIVLAPAYPDQGVTLTSDAGTRWSYRLSDESPLLPSLWLVSLSLEQRLARNLLVAVSYDALEGRRGLVSRLPGEAAPGTSLRTIELESSGRQSSRSLTSSVRVGRPGGRVWWFANYVWTTSIDDASSPLSVEPGRVKGASSNDVRHRLSSGVNLTLGRGLRLNARLQGRSGVPLDVTSALDLNGDGLLNDRPEGFERNSRRQPDWFTVDAGLRWSLAPRRAIPGGDAAGSAAGSAAGTGAAWRIEVSTQVTNLFDHGHGEGLVGVHESPLFGRPTATAPGRRVTASAIVRF